MKTTNWKEEFDKYFIGDPGVLTETSFPNGQGIKDFISHQIIEKIIDEMDNLPTGLFDSTPYKDGFKQQLKDKWLKEK